MCRRTRACFRSNRQRPQPRLGRRWLRVVGGGARGHSRRGPERVVRVRHATKVRRCDRGQCRALIAPFAFLGSAYDDRLAAIYTTTGDHNIFRLRMLSGVLWADSLVDPTPLRPDRRRGEPPEFLDRVEAEHRNGRPLYVATTDLDSKRQVVWDLGAIAAGGAPRRRTLFCDVILASCSFPAVFPPVPIDVEIDGRRHTELHVDGAVSANAFLPPAALGVGLHGATDPGAGQRELYVIVSGPLSPARKPVERRLYPVFGEALVGILAGRQNDDLLRMYLLSRYVGAGYHLAAISEDLPTDRNALKFETGTMGRLYRGGREVGRSGQWTESPPGISPDEASRPRGGLRLRQSSGRRVGMGGDRRHHCPIGASRLGHASSR